MRILGIVSVICTCASTAIAVDFRWTRGFAQGTTEAIIRNADDASLNIYCPSGQLETIPGMFLHTSKLPKGAKEVTVQIVVDGKNHPFYFHDGSQFIGGGWNAFKSLSELVESLQRAKGKTFTAEFPKYGFEERFSLLDVRKSIGRGKDSVLTGCDF